MIQILTKTALVAEFNKTDAYKYFLIFKDHVERADVVSNSPTILSETVKMFFQPAVTSN